jgi:hypothetical protein
MSSNQDQMPIRFIAANAGFAAYEGYLFLENLARVV